jgi:prolyl-tRNA editing enzyme YbaK/EbsC (Cys-tRNA(Pro) deacylase)
MSVEKVKEYLEGYGLADRIREFDVSSATVALAAEALGVDGARIAKSLAFHAGDHALLVVAAGDARVDNARFKQTFGRKARMLSFEEAAEMVGHTPGGVCPFAVKEGVEVWLDESLKRFETVFPACGSSNSAIELTLEELEKAAKPLGWVNVCKLSEAQIGG